MTAGQLEDCCRRCLGCGSVWCRNNDSRAGEAEGLCPDCHEAEAVE